MSSPLRPLLSKEGSWCPGPWGRAVGSPRASCLGRAACTSLQVPPFSQPRALQLLLPASLKPPGSTLFSLSCVMACVLIPRDSLQRAKHLNTGDLSEFWISDTTALILQQVMGRAQTGAQGSVGKKTKHSRFLRHIPTFQRHNWTLTRVPSKGNRQFGICLKCPSGCEAEPEGQAWSSVVLMT